jgi:hypothetical protein
MDGEALGKWMVRRGALDAEGLRRAQQRQSIYGGSLDTVVLELGLSDEATVAACLTEATGLPAPGAAWLEAPARDLAGLLAPAAARRLGGQPVARLDDRLEVVTRYGAPLREIGLWAGGLDLNAHCYIVPEVRFEALLSLVHGKPVPPRFAALLGRVVGRSRARRLAEPHTPAAREVAQPPVDTGPRPRRPERPAPPPEPETELDVTEDIAEPPAPPPPPPRPPPPAEIPISALLAEWTDAATPAERRKTLARKLRRHLGDAALAPTLKRWRAAAAAGGEPALTAMEKLAELRDRDALPALLDRVGDDEGRISAAAQAALRTITRHDFGTARWRWTRWWREWKDHHRIEWLIDALTEKDAELRLEAAQELEELSGRYFGYHFDLGRREREEARRRWFDWWQNTGKATLG